jgi:CO dehydrogenase maturation factor
MGLNDGRVVCVCGKGGVGKTAFVSLLVKALVEDYSSLKKLVIDADPAMGISSTLGVRPPRTIGEIRDEVIAKAKQKEMGGVSDTLDYMLFEALFEGSEFYMLSMGSSRQPGCFCPINSFLRNAIKALAQNFDVILIDGEAGLEQVHRKVMERVDTLVVLTDTSMRGVKTAASIKEMADSEGVMNYKNMGVVINRAKGKEDAIKNALEDLGLSVFGMIPEDAVIADYDRAGKSILSLPRETPSFTAVQKIIGMLLPASNGLDIHL